jgi:hypothetical protein
MLLFFFLERSGKLHVKVVYCVDVEVYQSSHIR